MAQSRDYRALSLELDETIAKLQQSDLNVEEAVELYEKGLQLIKQLETRLKQAENKINQLKLAAADPE